MTVAPTRRSCAGCNQDFVHGEERIRGHRASWHPRCHRYAHGAEKPGPDKDPNALRRRGKFLTALVEPQLYAQVAARAESEGITITDAIRKVMGTWANP